MAIAAALGAESARAYDADYDRLFPYFLEYSTSTQVKPIGASSGGIGGHAVVYIRGLCKDFSVKFPRVKVCDPREKLPFAHDGVGISVDSQYKNANWVAVPGYDFFMHGDLPPGAELNKESWQTTLDRAREMKIFEGIRFHDNVLDPSLPADEYEKKVVKLCSSTDYALTYGRTMTSHRVPISGKHLQAIADYLNEANARYVSGKEIYTWSGLKNNCAHLSARIFAIAGIRQPIPQELPFEEQILNLAVPANGLGTVQQKSNFRNIDAGHVWKNDPGLRKSILEHGELPIGAGSITKRHHVVTKNQIYFTDLKRLILIPKPLCKAPSILRNMFLSVRRARYTDLSENLRLWISKYERALSGTSSHRCRGSDCAEFMDKYARVLRREIERSRAMLSEMEPLAIMD